MSNKVITNGKEQDPFAIIKCYLAATPQATLADVKNHILSSHINLKSDVTFDNVSVYILEGNSVLVVRKDGEKIQVADNTKKALRKIADDYGIDYLPTDNTHKLGRMVRNALEERVADNPDCVLDEDANELATDLNGYIPKLDDAINILESNYSGDVSNVSYRAQEMTLHQLFHRDYPNNDNLNEIIVKVATLNSCYSTHIGQRYIYEIARAIYLDTEFDDKLSAGDERLVEHISNYIVDYHPYSFATKYCCLHNPTCYPIYDSFVQQMLWAFMKRDKFANGYKLKDLKSYSKFKQVIDLFRDRYNLKQLTYRQLDHYLWFKGKELFKK